MMSFTWATYSLLSMSNLCFPWLYCCDNTELTKKVKINDMLQMTWCTYVYVCTLYRVIWTLVMWLTPFGCWHWVCKTLECLETSLVQEWWLIHSLDVSQFTVCQCQSFVFTHSFSCFNGHWQCCTPLSQCHMIIHYESVCTCNDGAYVRMFILCHDLLY